jgi:hypothetical protein
MNFKRKQVGDSLRYQTAAPYNPEVFDVASLEAEIGEAMHSIERDAPSQEWPPAGRVGGSASGLPHTPATVAEIGKVTAEAVMTQYEAAAKTIAEMKKPIEEWVAQCERALADLKAAMQYIEETATKFRTMGQETHDKIQRSSAAITEVRQTCDTIREKIGP